MKTAILQRILEITRELAEPFDLDTMLARVVDSGRELLDAERGSVFLYESGPQELVSTVATGTGVLRFPADRGIIGEVARTRRIVNVADCYADPRFNPDSDRRTGYRTRCLLTVPLVGHDDSLVGVLQLLNKRGGAFDVEDERVAAALAAQCAVAIHRVRMTHELLVKERLGRELALAREIQLGFLPRAMPSVRGYEIWGMSRPAEETGGDTFDLVPLEDGRLVLLLADATGHGLGPALSVTQVRAMLRIAVRIGADLDAGFGHINDQLVQDLSANRFVTAFLGVLDADRHRIRYHSAGQAPLLHVRAAERRCEWLGATTFPMGFMQQDPPPAPAAVELAPGDVLALITDGVYEYEDPSEEAFGRDGVGRVALENLGRPVRELGESLLQAVGRHARGVPQADDVTVLLVRRLPD